jgi:cellulose biosynthesis protein BcsQ
MTTLAIYSNKGGVGKTAAAVNLSFLAALEGMRTLIVDLDPQSSTTYYFRVKPKIKRTARGFVGSHVKLSRSIKGTDYERLDLLPADFSHRNLDIVFGSLKRSKYRLQKALKPFRKEYDLLVLDCHSIINIVAENVFNASDLILIPIAPTTLSIRSYEQLVKFLKDVRFDKENVYTFFSMVDRRKKLHKELVDWGYHEYKRLMESQIPYLSIIERMGIERQPVMCFAPKSNAAMAYQGLWNEVKEKLLVI